MNRRLASHATLLATLLALPACAHTVIVSQASAEMDRARVSPDVKAAAPLAPQEFQHAEAERALAVTADEQKDATAADLDAERARLAYERTVVLARLARATDAEAVARSTVAKQSAEAIRLAIARVTFEKEADATSNELAVAKERLTPARVGPADASRERARLLAANSLAAEAHLLCGAARLLAQGAKPATTTDSANHLDAAVQGETALAATLAHAPAGHGRAPIDEAARTRAACLDALTRTRRGAAFVGADDADALLAALSSHGGWDPSRDERGVLVTLRGSFQGQALTPEADRQLHELGRVAAAHPGFPLQVVVHDATAPSEAEQAKDLARAQTALTALTAGSTTPVAQAEAVGAHLPRTDPESPQSRARNARLEVVFVSRSD